MTRTTDGRNCISTHSRQCDCQFCEREWANYFEGQCRDDRLALADIELRHAKPASDREWQEFIDREFPKVQP